MGLKSANFFSELDVKWSHWNKTNECKYANLIISKMHIDSLKSANDRSKIREKLLAER